MTSRTRKLERKNEQRIEYLRAKVSELEADARRLAADALPPPSVRDAYYRVARDLDAARGQLRRAEADRDR